MPHILVTGDRQYLTFVFWKIPSTSAGFELAILGTRSGRANSYVTEIDPMKNILLFIVNHFYMCLILVIGLLNGIMEFCSFPF